MPNKSHELGGKRTKGRHVSELGVGGALALLLVSFVPESWGLDAFQMNLSGVVLTGTFSTVAKMLHEAGGLAKILRLSLVLGLFLPLGCAVQMGKVDPKIHTGADGETIVACTVTGVSVAWGDASVCRNTEGGHVSEAFAGMWTTTVDTIRTIVAAVFVPFGAVGAVGQQIAAAPAPVFPEVPDTPPAFIHEPEEPTDSSGASVPDWFSDGP